MADIKANPVAEKTRPNGSDEENRRPSWTPGQEDGALATLQQVNQHDQHHPVHWSVWKKWYITALYCLLQVFVSMTSTSYVSVEFLIEEQFGGSQQVITLGQSLFLVGNAVGPAFLGPLS